MGQVIAEIDPSEDFIAVTVAEEAMKQRAAERAAEADDVRESFRALSHQLEAARISAQRPRTVPSETQHTQILHSLAEQQISLGKGINEAQDTLRSREAEVGRLKAEVQQLESRDEGAEHVLDSTALRLEITRGLGFEAVIDRNEAVSKVLILSQSGDVHRVALDEGKPAYEVADRLWSLAQS